MSEKEYLPKIAMSIVAHPDDQDFTVAGTLAKWAKAGCKVISVLITSGDSGSNDPAKDGSHKQALAEMRGVVVRDLVTDSSDLAIVGAPQDRRVRHQVADVAHEHERAAMQAHLAAARRRGGHAGKQCAQRAAREHDGHRHGPARRAHGGRAGWQCPPHGIHPDRRHREHRQPTQ